MFRATFLAGALVAAATFAVPQAMAADWQPGGPITLQIGFGAGGETDTMGRVIAKAMEDATGWDVVVENKPGGGGVAMFTGLAAAKPDGRTLGMGVNMPVLINLLLRGDKLPFVLDSFDYLATVARAQQAIVAKADAPFDDFKGLVAHAKSHDGALIAFDAKPQELLLNVIEAQAGADLKPVSTKSSAEMVQNVLGGHVIASFAAGVHIPYLESGDLKMLASANAGRHSYAPDTPTLIEQGYDVFVDPYFYIAAPKGLPAEAKAALAKALGDAIHSAEVKKVIVNAMATEPSNLGPEGTRKMLDDTMTGVKVLFGK